MDESKMKTVFTIVRNEEKQKSFWVKLGMAYVNRDGSINVKLDALPVNNTLQIRDYEPPELREARFADRRSERTPLD